MKENIKKDQILGRAKVDIEGGEVIGVVYLNKQELYFIPDNEKVEGEPVLLNRRNTRILN